MGRPKKLTHEQVEEGIEKYFKHISITTEATKTEWTGDKDDQGNKIYMYIPVLNDAGEQVRTTKYTEIPSIIKLSHYLGIDRDTLLEYSKSAEYSGAIKRAKEIIEAYWASQLIGKTPTGPIFYLKCNCGWRDTQTIEITAKNKLEDFFGKSKG